MVVKNATINVVLIFIYVMTHKKGIGGGDIKLLSASGLLLGWQKNILAFFLASCGMILDQMILKNLGKTFAPAGSVPELEKSFGLDAAGVAAAVREAMNHGK